MFDCYVDYGFSGKKDSRPRLNPMMQDAHERRFDVVVVWRFDRFARSVSHLLRALETFNSLGVQFVSLSEQVDTSTPTGKMVFTVLGAVAELERNLIVERVRAGLRHARSKGKQLGATQEIDRCGSDQIHASKWCFLASDRSNVGSFSRFGLCSSQACPPQESRRRYGRSEPMTAATEQSQLPEIAPKGVYFYLATTTSPTDKGRRYLYTIHRPKKRFGEVRVTLSPDADSGKAV